MGRGVVCEEGDCCCRESEEEGQQDCEELEGRVEEGRVQVRGAEGGARVGDDGADVEGGCCAGAVGAEETAGVEGAGLAEEVQEDGV